MRHGITFTYNKKQHDLVDKTEYTGYLNKLSFMMKLYYWRVWWQVKFLLKGPLKEKTKISNILNTCCVLKDQIFYRWKANNNR